MIDQDNMRALAKGLRAAGPLACREAADAIYALLEELEAAAAESGMQSGIGGCATTNIWTRGGQSPGPLIVAQTSTLILMTR